MKNLTNPLAFAAACCLAAVPSLSPAAAYIRFNGIDGKTEQRSTAEFQWSLALAGNTFDPFHPAYTGGLRVAVGDVDGRWAGVALTVDGPGTGDPPVLRYEMKNVLVTSYSVSSDAAGESWLKLADFSAVSMVWRPLRANGSLGDEIVGNWDVASGRFSGDIAVLGAFDAPGFDRWADGTLTLTTPVPEPAAWALWLVGAAFLARQLRRQAR
jgi:hypothetical protein